MVNPVVNSSTADPVCLAGFLSVSVPQGEEIHVRLKLTHPDFVSETRWGSLQDEQSITMESLRDRSATITMHRGVVLAGTVTDSDGRPVRDAVVIWGDDPYSEDGRQEVLTDMDGVFRLLPLRARPTKVTVVAAGWSPAAKTIDIGAANPRADFQLKKGRILRIWFIDRNGDPVPNVRVGIRGWRGSKSLYNHRDSTVLDTGIPRKADAGGVFEWRWAPEDEVDFSFYAKGFGRTQRSLTADGTEHIVILLREGAP